MLRFKVTSGTKRISRIYRCELIRREQRAPDLGQGARNPSGRERRGAPFTLDTSWVAFPHYGHGLSANKSCAATRRKLILRVLQLMRAASLRRALVRLLRGEEAFRGEALWDKHRLVRWCRHHLYTPIDAGATQHFTHTHTHTHSLTHSRAHTCTHTVSLGLSLSLSHTHTHRCSLGLSLSLTHTHTDALLVSLSLSLTHTHTHTHTHAHMHACIAHTRTHTRTHTPYFYQRLAFTVTITSSLCCFRFNAKCHFMQKKTFSQILLCWAFPRRAAAEVRTRRVAPHATPLGGAAHLHRLRDGAAPAQRRRPRPAARRLRRRRRRGRRRRQRRRGGRRR